MSEKIVQLNEEVIKDQLKELVRGSVEETLNELLEHCAVLLNLLRYHVLAVKVHHIQAHQSLVCHLRIEESKLEELKRKLVLANLCVYILLLSRNLDVKDRESVSHIHTECHALCLRLKVLVAVGDESLCTVLTDNAELSRHIVELTDQFNAHIDDLGVGAICR